jgi:hypothetical protein
MATISVAISSPPIKMNIVSRRAQGRRYRSPARRQFTAAVFKPKAKPLYSFCAHIARERRFTPTKAAHGKACMNALK